MEQKQKASVQQEGPYSNQGGLLKVERDQLQKEQQGPGSGVQSREGSGKKEGSSDINTTVQQYPVGIDGKGPVQTFTGPSSAQK